MTPELPRAPRSRAEALVEAAWPMEREGFFLASAADGEGHIGAGVAVGDGEHVEFVDALLLGVDGSGGMDDHALEQRPVDTVDHSSLIPFS